MHIYVQPEHVVEVQNEVIYVEWVARIRAYMHIYVHLEHVVEVQNEVLYVQLVVRIRAYLHVYVHICTSTCTVNASYTCPFAPVCIVCTCTRACMHIHVHLHVFIYIYVWSDHVVETSVK